MMYAFGLAFLMKAAVPLIEPVITAALSAEKHNTLFHEMLFSLRTLSSMRNIFLPVDLSLDVAISRRTLTTRCTSLSKYRTITG